MSTEQASVTEAKVQVAAEAARAVVQAMTMSPADNNQRAQNAGCKLDRPIMNQPTFNWGSTDKYAELRNFKMEEKYVSKLLYKSSRKSAHYKKKLAREAKPTAVRNSNSSRERNDNAEKGLFETPGNKFKPHYNETIK